MTTILGADADQLRTLSTAMTTAAGRLEQSVTTVGTRAADASVWRGADAERFRSEWSSSIVPALRSVAAGLREASGRLTREAAEQDAASSAAGPGATGSPAHHPPGASTPTAGSPGSGFSMSPEAMRDLALFAAGKLDPDIATASMIADYGGRLDELVTNINSGDGLNTANSLIGLAGGVLRDVPLGPVGELSGSAIGLAQFIGEHAAEADFSAEGINTVTSFIADDPMGALQGAGEGIADNAAEILGLVPWIPGVHR
ncbi:WXG100 family type VII secretion target [Williamsia maris]|uniref:WXG100 family type VII secretion target n=1 Tax=Williamsia maris TaxID=72806 RepID=A0ABT1HC89_9NOCA|nr:hypothetical protein [Williamsia maris]MCP2174600.1 hypothetical protein [Williamsia maris]